MSYSTLKSELVTGLSGYNVLPYRGSRVAAPVAWVEDDSPVIREGRSYGEKTVHLTVTFIPKKHHSNETTAELLDELIEDVVPDIEAIGEWYVTEVQTGLLADEATGADHAAATFHIQTTIKI